MKKRGFIKGIEEVTASPPQALRRKGLGISQGFMDTA